MTNPDFVYATYIRTSPEKVWAAITTPEFTRQYWVHELQSDWKKGSRWTMTRPGDSVPHTAGTVLENIPPSRLVMTWAEGNNPGDMSQVSFEIDKVADMVRLTVTHSLLSADMGSRISKGWPLVLARMKSYLEVGKGLDIMATK